VRFKNLPIAAPARVAEDEFMSVISIGGAVGLNAPNRKEDVIKVQVMLNHFVGNKKLVGVKPLAIKPLTKDGICGEKTRVAISAFQFQNGLVSDEHFNGQIRPGGMTIKFMNQHAGHIPKATKDDTRYYGLEDKLRQFELEEMAMEAIRDSFNPTKQKEASMRNIVKELLKAEFNPIGDGVGSTAHSTISAASNVEKWVSFVKDFYAIFQSGLGTSGAMASVGTVGFAFSVLGPFVTFWGFCIKLIKARSNAEEYQAVACAFTTTAWAFGDICPRRSDGWWKRKKGGLAPLAGYLDEGELNRDWASASRQTLAGLKQLVATNAARAGMSTSQAERCLKRGMRLPGRQNLCEAVLRSLAKEARNKGKENLATGIEGAAGLYTDPSGTASPSSVGAIQYPKK
jgi:hypothetical protein